ncbi:hypothetical protein EDC96DRAFT_447418, partial [Choanephora cucurbitarum]
TPITRTVPHIVLSLILAKHAVSMEVQNPREYTFKKLTINSGNRKRKKPTSKGTATGQYMKFVQKAMNEMDYNPEMKGFYATMNNSPTHASNKMDTMVTERSMSVFISPELDLIEQFWSIIEIMSKVVNFK